jgi:DNA-binding beta-propeller fold protein YncE
MTKKSLFALTVLATVGASCARNLDGIEPPKNALYFPISVAVSADQRYAYVANSNFDLRYNAGWVSVIDLDAALAQIDAGNDNPTSAIVSRVKVLSLAGELSLDETGELAVLTHRGEPTLTLLEVAGDQLDCGDPDATKGVDQVEERTDCDSLHLERLTPDMFPEGEIELGEVDVADPYASAMFTWRPDGEPERSLAAIGHLTAASDGGRVSVFDVIARSGVVPPRLEPVRSIGLPARNGIAALVPHPDAGGSFVLGTGQLYSVDSPGSTLYSVDVGGTLATEEDRVSSVRVSAELGGDELYGLAFSPDGRRAFAANRRPDAVVVLDTSIETVEEPQRDGTIDDIDRPRLRILGATPVPDKPTGIVYLPRANGDVVAVASLDGDVVFVLTPLGAELQISGRLDDVGLGPYGMAHATRAGRELLLVTTFFDHGLAIFDVTSPEPASFVRVAHIRSGKTEPAQEAR